MNGFCLLLATTLASQALLAEAVARIFPFPQLMLFAVFFVAAPAASAPGGAGVGGDIVPTAHCVRDLRALFGTAAAGVRLFTGTFFIVFPLCPIVNADAAFQ